HAAHAADEAADGAAGAEPDASRERSRGASRDGTRDPSAERTGALAEWSPDTAAADCSASASTPRATSPTADAAIGHPHGDARVAGAARSATTSTTGRGTQ